MRARGHATGELSRYQSPAKVWEEGDTRDDVIKRVINREMGDLHKDLIAPAPLITYLRYNVSLTPESLTALGMTLPDALSENLSAMDDPANMATLQEVGARAAKQQLSNGDFPATFDLAS